MNGRLTRAAVIADFEQAMDAAPFAPAFAFDLQLRDRAATECALLLEKLSGAGDLYGWAGESEAYSSGVEAWLQYQLLLALFTQSHRHDTTTAFVVRVLSDGDLRDTRTLHGSRCRFLIVPSNLIDQLVALQKAILSMTVWAQGAYSGADPWCRSNYLGGPNIEALLRGEHIGLAYGAALEFLGGDTTYSNSDYLGEPDHWLPPETRLAGDGGLGVGETDVEILVRAPLRVALFREWGHNLLTVMANHPRGTFWREAAADVVAISQLRGIEQRAYVHGSPWTTVFGEHGCYVGIAIYLQMRRVDLLQRGLSPAITYLCLSGDGAERPPMIRLSQGEVMHRCMQILGVVTHEQADAIKMILPLAVDEMQLFVASVAAVLIGRFGGTIDLASLRQVGWEEMRDWFEDARRDLSRYSADEIRDMERAAHEEALRDRR